MNIGRIQDHTGLGIKWTRRADSDSANIFCDERNYLRDRRE